MTNYIHYLSDLRSITKNYGDYQGAMLLPGGLLCLVIGAKMLFATYDTSVVDSPSLFDSTGNIYWETATVIANISILFLILIHYWYKEKIGIVVTKQEQKILDIAIAVSGIIVFMLSVLLDYNFVALFSFVGMTFCGMWIIGFFKNSNLKKMHSVNLLIQLTALIIGPVLFADLQSDVLNYQRHIVGLCTLTAGVLLILSGIIIHSYLMKQLKKNRSFNQND